MQTIEKFHAFLGGTGIVIISTQPMTDREARARKLGGELLCYLG
jgi:ribosomal protein S8